jgi:hypothetical protein
MIFSNYPAKTPFAVIEQLLGFCEGRVYDPFCGSGMIPIYLDMMGYEGVAQDLVPAGQILYNALLENSDYSLLDKAKELYNDVPPKPINKINTTWHPEEFLEFISKTWAVAEALGSNTLTAALWDATILFSYADERRSKPSITVESQSKVNVFLQSPLELWWFALQERLDKIMEFKYSFQVRGGFRFRSYIDSAVDVASDGVDMVITAPPLLNSHQYIRSSKIPLAWLTTPEHIATLSKLEIPYRKTAPEIILYSKTAQKLPPQHEIYYKSVISSIPLTRTIIIILRKIYKNDIPIETPFVEHYTSLNYKAEILPITARLQSNYGKAPREEFVAVILIA